VVSCDFLYDRRLGKVFHASNAGFLRRHTVRKLFSAPEAPLLPIKETPRPRMRGFRCDLGSFSARCRRHQSQALNRSRMDRNNSLGTATLAIWKTTCREWRTTFAPILISFSRNVGNVQ